MVKTTRKSGIVVPHPLRWYQHLAVSLLSLALWAVTSSWRRRWDNQKEPEPIPGPVIFCIWHNPLAINSYSKLAHKKWPAKGLAALISASRDGAFLAAVVEKLGIQTIRGSSSRRGAQALLEATSWLEKGFSVGITPDGPRGPRYKIQPGIIQLAQVSGRPIVPISSYVRRKYCFRSWDQFQIPYPFARCNLRYGAPIYVPRDASEAERETIRQQLEQAMMKITTD